MIERLTFVTSNVNKLQQVRHILGNGVEHIDYEIPEIQSDYLRDIVEQKAFDAFKAFGGPLLVEDASLSINALNGFPGPLVKPVLKKIGIEGILKQLINVVDRIAYGQVMFAYHNGQNVSSFNGVVKGSLSEYPRGENGFGWDSIFIPEGYTRTRAEMYGEEFDLTSPRVKALIELQKHFER